MNAHKLKRIFTNWKVILLIVLVIGAIFFISPTFGKEGAAIRNVEKDSAATLAGFVGPTAKDKPLDREVVLSVNSEAVKNAADYYRLTTDLEVNSTVIIKTDKTMYSLTVIAANNSNVTSDLGLSVYDAPTSNIKKGLDLQGGTRVLLQPEDPLTPDQFNSIKSNLEARLNVYGLSDVSVSISKNLQLKPEYIVIEIAGTTVQEIEELVSKQGKFEAKINNVTIFQGEKNDIAYVGKGATDSKIDSCGRADSGYSCRFQFSIKLTPSAAQHFGNATKNLAVSGTGTNAYLDKQIELYLDGELVDSLNIAASLKGRTDITDIAISGSGFGSSLADAKLNTTNSMKKLQTVIETGSLPSKLKIAKVDTISAVLGKGFLANIALTGILAILAVAIVLLIRYRSFLIITPMMIALVSEILLVIGMYAYFGMTLDLLSIAGLIILAGTGVDHLVVITDEVLRKDGTSLEGSIKKAFGIIMGVFFTTGIAMVPLYFAGAGLIRGFAIVTIAGLVLGVFLTRPVYAKIVEVLYN
jgi:preprotein translocase subunit SecD